MFRCKLAQYCISHGTLMAGRALRVRLGFKRKPNHETGPSEMDPNNVAASSADYFPLSMKEENAQPIGEERNKQEPRRSYACWLEVSADKATVTKEEHVLDLKHRLDLKWEHLLGLFPGALELRTVQEIVGESDSDHVGVVVCLHHIKIVVTSDVLCFVMPKDKAYGTELLRRLSSALDNTQSDGFEVNLYTVCFEFSLISAQNEVRSLIENVKEAQSKRDVTFLELHKSKVESVIERLQKIQSITDVVVLDGEVLKKMFLAHQPSPTSISELQGLLCFYSNGIYVELKKLQSLNAKISGQRGSIDSSKKPSNFFSQSGDFFYGNIFQHSKNF